LVINISILLGRDKVFTRVKYIISFFILLIGIIAGCEVKEVQKVNNGKVISPSMPLADKAREFLKNKLKGKEIILVYDKGDPKDKFNRELAYIFVDGKCIQTELLREGLAIIRYVKEPNTALYDEFKKAESEARSQGKGVWAIVDYVKQKESESYYNLEKRDI